ncbi:unnamed protein product, partial [Prorocentrum cordatum]
MAIIAAPLWEQLRAAAADMPAAQWGKQAIRLLVYGRGSYARKDCLRVYLTDVTGGAKFDPKTDGGEA